MGFRAVTPEQKAARRTKGFNETRDSILTYVQGLAHEIDPNNSRNRGKLAAVLAAEAALSSVPTA